MLITTLTVTARIPKGSNVIEMVQRGTITIQTMTGDEKRPKMVYAFVTGSSVGGTVQTIAAPIDLLIGDVLEVTSDGVPVRVVRGDEAAWENDEIAELQTEHAEKAQAKQDELTAKRKKRNA